MLIKRENLQMTLKLPKPCATATLIMLRNDRSSTAARRRNPKAI